jgi:hypothetical protein
VSTNPFDALGLPARPDLTDEQVRAAWRSIAAATHPDRPDGGDVPRYTAAASAYALLRTLWGRSEAYADVATAGAGTAPLPTVAAADLAPARLRGAVSARGAGSPRGAGSARGAGSVRGAVWLLPVRVWRGRPVRLALRALAGVVLARLALGVVPGQPAGPAVVTGIITWFLLTGRGDLAPPPGR